MQLFDKQLVNFNSLDLTTPSILRRAKRNAQPSVIAKLAQGIQRVIR
jgi:hypothetical protein